MVDLNMMSLFFFSVKASMTCRRRASPPGGSSRIGRVSANENGISGWLRPRASALKNVPNSKDRSASIFRHRWQCRAETSVGVCGKN